MDAETIAAIAAWVRDRLVDWSPGWLGLDAHVQQAPDCLLILGAPAVVAVLGLFVLKVVHELWDTLRRVADTIAGRRKPDPATEEGLQAIQRQVSKIMAVLENWQSGSLHAEAEAARKDAVSNLVQDQAEPAREAARDLAQGDLEQGFAVLEREARAAEAMAVEKWRRLGALAAGVDTARARAAYEEAFRLDPGDFWTCVFLARLRRQAGDLDAAQVAVGAMEAAENSERERSVANNEAGDVLFRAGDVAGARRRYEASLEVAERFAAASPASAEAERDLAVSLAHVGDILLFGEGDPVAAKPFFERALRIAKRLAKQNPDSAQAQRDLSMSLSKLGDALMKANEGAGAKRLYEASLDIVERLVAASPRSRHAQRDLLVNLRKLGDASMNTGDWAAARQRHERSLDISKRLVAANPASAQAQRDVSLSLSQLGDVLKKAGDVDGAAANWKESLALRERLAAANPGSAEAQRDVWLSLWRLASLEGAGVAWKDVLARIEAMQAAGTLIPADQPFLEQARRLAAEAAEAAEAE